MVIPLNRFCQPVWEQLVHCGCGGYSGPGYLDFSNPFRARFSLDAGRDFFPNIPEPVELVTGGSNRKVPRRPVRFEIESVTPDPMFGGADPYRWSISHYLVAEVHAAANPSAVEQQIETLAGLLRLGRIRGWSNTGMGDDPSEEEALLIKFAAENGDIDKALATCRAGHIPMLDVAHILCSEPGRFPDPGSILKLVITINGIGQPLGAPWHTGDVYDFLRSAEDLQQSPHSNP